MIPSRRVLAAITVVGLLVATPVLAEWTVARVSQPARHAADGRACRPLALGLEVPNHACIHTGRTGRLLLRHAADMIQFKPNAVAALSRCNEGGFEGTILEKFGLVLFDVEPRPDRWRGVETAWLAAVAKNTPFELTGRRTGAELGVGVEATHPTLGRRADGRAEQAAIVQGHNRFAVSGGRPEPRIVPVEPREPRVVLGTPARAPVPPAGPHAGSDGASEPARRAEQRVDGPLGEPPEAPVGDEDRRPGWVETNPGRPVEDDPPGSDPGGGAAPDAGGAGDGGVPEVNLSDGGSGGAPGADMDDMPGHKDDPPRIDDEPGTDADGAPDSGIPSPGYQPDTDDSDLDEARAPVDSPADAPRQG